MSSTPAATTKKRRTTEMIAARDLTVDHTVQREMIPSRVKKLADEMDLDSIGVITINRRSDGTNSVVDGQHRVAALLRLDFGEWKIKCDVYHGLDLDDEARLWRRLNNTRRPGAFDDFRAALVEGEPESVEINRIIEAHGLRLHNQKVDGAIRCVDKLRQVYRGGSSRRNGVPHPEALDAALNAAVASWGPTPDAVDGAIVHGLGLFFLQHNGDVDKASLHSKLAKFPGGPRALIGKARGLADLRPGTVAGHLSTIVTDVYNAKRTSGRLK